MQILSCKSWPKLKGFVVEQNKGDVISQITRVPLYKWRGGQVVRRC